MIISGSAELCIDIKIYLPRHQTVLQREVQGSNILILTERYSYNYKILFLLIVFVVLTFSLIFTSCMLPRFSLRYIRSLHTPLRALTNTISFSDTEKKELT